MAVYILLLAVISFTPPETAQGQECGTGNFPRREQFLLNETIDYQLPNGAISVGYLFIAPQLKFDCHGTITSWHALTYFDTGDTTLDALFHDITFQLWRPSAEDNRVYSFVGSNIARFIGNEIRTGRTILEDGTQFFNLTSTPPAQERLQFQPGDVIGWYIHTGVQATVLPLSIVCRYVTSDDENEADMFSTVISDSDFAATPPPCDVAVCSTNTTLIPSVIPYITVEYETLSDPPDTGRIEPPLCVNNSSPLNCQQECGIENFPRREQFLLNEAIDYQSPNTSVFIGYLVIAPQLKFDCHGSITSWHALTNFNTVDAALDVLHHVITFMLWRPSAEDNRLYSFVGSNIARFLGNDIRTGRTILEDGTQFSNLTSTSPAQERLQFQPGDVIGWYIHTGVQATELPLSIVYRPVTSDDESAADLFSTVITDSSFAATPPPCDLAVCSTNTTLIPSVIPYITVEYETLSDPPETGRIDPHLCVNNSPPLHLTTTTESTPPDRTQSITNPETVVTTIKSSTPPDQTNSITNSETVSPQSKGISVPIAIAVIVVMVILLIGLISLGFPVLLMVYQRSRNSTTQNTGIRTIDLMAHNEGAGPPVSGRQQNPYEFS